MLSSHLEKILGRLDDLDSINLTILVQRLARERELLETIFNTINEGILVIRSNGLIEYSNQMSKTIIGLKDKDVGTAILWKLVPELHQFINLQNTPFNKDIVFSRELEISYPENRFLRIYIVPFPDIKLNSEFNNENFIVILTDITKEKISIIKKIENESISSVFMLAAEVAHELGNPLNTLNIHLALIKRNLKKQFKEDIEFNKIIKSVKICTNEVNRLSEIIKNFLNAIRPKSPNLIEISIIKILEEVLLIQNDEINNSGIKIETNIKEKMPLILGDKNQLKQVFFNVIKNGLQAMSKGGILKIITNLDDDWIYIRFQDNGNGICKKDLAKIFRPFFTTKKHGYGLGIVIIQRIMREHGGYVGVDSEKEKGTTIILQFPLVSKKLKMLN